MAGATVVLMYHRVAEEPDDPFGLAVRPDRFADHLRVATSLADAVPLADVRRRAGGARVAVTIDDGYADVARAALPALEAAGLPATVFVVSGALGSGRPLWPLELERAFRTGRPAARHLALVVAGSRLVVDTGDEAARLRGMRAVHARLRRRPPAEIAATLDAVHAFFGTAPDDEARRMLTVDEVRELAAHPLVTLGAHTRRHPWLATLPAAAQREEIAGSRADLERIAGRRVDQIAYPFGSRDAYRLATLAAARRAGFALGCTTLPGPVVRTTRPLLLPRFAVGDWDPETFRARLAGWLAS